MSISPLAVIDVATDLEAEQIALDAVVADLPAKAWATPTPSPQWTVGDQIGHLTYFDVAAEQAITDPTRFRATVESLLQAARGGNSAIDDLTIGPYRSMSAIDRLTAWREGRERLAAAAVRLAEDARVPWYGPSMGSKSFLTARLMEVWAHGQDVIDAIHSHRPATDRLKHIAQLGVITRKWSYTNRQMEIPDSEVDVVLVAPSGVIWNWGPGDAASTVRGEAEDFCLVVTQRRHVDDTGLQTVGDAARSWMVQAQAFAGPPTDGPEAGRF